MTLIKRAPEVEARQWSRQCKIQLESVIHRIDSGININLVFFKLSLNF